MKADAFDPQLVVEAVRAALGGRATAALHAAPPLTAPERERLAEMIGSEPAGNSWIREFEYALAGRVRRKHGIAVSSGTAALHLALAALGVGKGDRVALPALSFSAAAAAVRYTRAKPYFYDNRPDAGIVCGDEVPVTIGVDLLGLSTAYPFPPVPMIEDAAQALGTIDHGRPCGSFGFASVLSFNNNKIVTTGGGGMLLTDDDAFAERARYLATTAKAPSEHHYVHTEVGFNYRMSAPAAALGLVMLDRLDAVLEAKVKLHRRYAEAFADLPGVVVIETQSGVRWNHWLNAIKVPRGQREATLQALTAAGYEGRALYTPLPDLSPYARFAAGTRFPEAEAQFATVVCLPSGPGLMQ